MPEKPEPGTPEPVDEEDDTTPIELSEPHRLFQQSSQGLRCNKCNRYLVWSDVSAAWWCVNLMCRWYRKLPAKP